ncbi:mitochondrial substrate carrier protein [Rutstroemia sp. NJR-2017a BVV2]|nr:mitochondrial substrate carrier protein [Rutstroemia sp. NJR-2017a BVV2]
MAFTKRHEFLRDRDQLAARMSGTIKVDDADTEFESFMFAKVDKESGKMEWLIERSVWGPRGGAPEHGVS